MSAVKDILRLVDGGERVIKIGSIYGSAKAYLFARIALHAAKRTVLLISPTEKQAEIQITDAQLFWSQNIRPIPKIFPDADVLPYLKLSPEPTRWADRIEILYRLTKGIPLALIAPITAVARKLPPKKYIATSAREIRIGESIDRDELARWLAQTGYLDVGLVEDEGSFAVRGSILDLWTPTEESPVRIELDGDTVASLRFFDPANQRSSEQTRSFTIIPACDIAFTEDAVSRVTAELKRRADAADFPTQERRRITELIRENISFPGIETLAPLFHHETASLLEYLPADALIILDEPDEIRHAAEAHLEGIRDIAGESSSIEKLVDPSEIYGTADDIAAKAAEKQVIELSAPEADVNVNTQPMAGIKAAIQSLMEKTDEWRIQGLHTAFICHTPVQAERLVDLFRWQNLQLASHQGYFETLREGASTLPRVMVGRLSEGFLWPEEKLAVATDEEIFGRKTPVRTPKKPPAEHFTSFAELADGDFLVHEDHGIGRYIGLRHLTFQDVEGDYLLLEYLGGDKLYLPVYRMNLIQRYVGSGEGTPFLDKLGGTRWSKVKKNVRRAIMAMAKDLLRLHAVREVYPGFKYPSVDAQYDEFCASFPYDETPDQESAIEDVLRDMEIEKPMDRLICGDVGYGKTEVAMRAAFRAAMAGKQVAVLVPTTILALQHYETFTERFGTTPVKVDMLSRFRSAKEQKITVEELKRGGVDIIIGTHRLLSKDIGFKDLGLIIVDEEHRFGVKHKERLKRLKEMVDVITLTATPIPRTLQLSLVGIREISVINTPPSDRLSVTTHVVPFDEAIIRRAVLDEITRGGQVFFVHNRVQTMRSMLSRLKELVPEARIEMAHGQMAEGELENVMIDFLEKKVNVLLCTAIIESGLDIPSANTIIINRADTFGLAQLYQLRGRVGRSNVRAYAYLLTPQDAPISPLAKKRLMVLKRFTELGSGFQIATHDLEIRGAGNFLGAQQSGHIAQIGYELYNKLLARTIRSLTGKELPDEIDPELKLMVEAYIPDSYIDEQGTRLDLYRRLATSENEEDIRSIQQELEDRFGKLPVQVKQLIEIMSIKITASRMRIKQMTFDGRTFSCQFDKTTPVDPAKAAGLTTSKDGQFRLHPPDKILLVTEGLSNADRVLETARNFLSALEACATQSFS